MTPLASVRFVAAATRLSCWLWWPVWGVVCATQARRGGAVARSLAALLMARAVHDRDRRAARRAPAPRTFADHVRFLLLGITMFCINFVVVYYAAHNTSPPGLIATRVLARRAGQRRDRPRCSCARRSIRASSSADCSASAASR